MSLHLIAKLYGGFFALDTRILAILAAAALLSSAGVVLAVKKVTGLKQAAPLFVAAAMTWFVVLVILFNVVLDYPVFVIRSFFELP